jgi:hypothetical protein
MAMNLSAPLAALEVDSNEISIRLLFRRIVLNKNAISAVREARGLFSRGIQIIHSNPRVSPYVLFWTRRAEELLNVMREHGYPVDPR